MYYCAYCCWCFCIISKSVSNTLYPHVCKWAEQNNRNTSWYNAAPLQTTTPIILTLSIKTEPHYFYKGRIYSWAVASDCIRFYTYTEYNSYWVFTTRNQTDRHYQSTTHMNWLLAAWLALYINSCDSCKTYHTLLVLVWSVTIRDPLYSSSSSGAIQRSGIHSLSGVR